MLDAEKTFNINKKNNFSPQMINHHVVSENNGHI